MRNDLADLSAFALVSEERSFTRAAVRLGVSQSALSHAIRGLEKRLGIQLVARTTRSVSPTAAGTALLRELAPALERIERAVAETRKQRETPSGRIRIIIPRTATQMVILPKLARFTRTYPEIVLEITSSNDPVDLVAGEYDAGVQLGEFIQRDMIAVRVTRGCRLSAVFSIKQYSPTSAGFERPLLHWLPLQQRALPMGVRERQEGAHGQPPGACVLRRSRPGYPGGIRWSRNRNSDGRYSRRPDRRGAPGPSTEGLVSFLSRILSLLSQPTESACRSGCPD
jgi:DNA-binding transcriptional LysR family regulator